ncbi:autotransporter outer membrane beta-barrel domain-containing protein [Pseudomonas sp. URMO17WK12:I11]|uniref:autotransporter outer membrane beta-barrel domain-containing protein n=2 Tax=Bacteria TaxID=2 RepID=UPI00074428E4|nr:autotransporter outer membrane beta-barrel domain-containing protein [Pseudomonas sp. URMO17WK12:I11]
MVTFGARFSRVSMSGALLMLGVLPAVSNAASCDSITCLTTRQENVLVNDGSSFDVGSGGTLVNSTVSHGNIHIWDAGVSVDTTVNGDGWLQIQDSGRAFDSVVESGGTMVVVGSATALSTTVTGGNLEVAQNAVVSDTLLNSGTMYVYMDATAKNTRVNNSQMTVYQNGYADQTTIYDGGLLSVSDTASAIDTTVNRGGQMESVSGTHVHFTTVNQGGLMVLGDRADASDTTINAGGVLQLKGDAILGGASAINGQVAFADPAVNGFHILMVKGPLTGNGTFLMNTDLASAKGDQIRVQGPISDSHTLVVADSGTAPSGAQQPLMLVNGNGGSGDFKLYGQTVDAGAYRYTLRQQGNDWYLAKPDVNTPDQDPQDPVNPPPDENPQQPVNPPVVDNPQVPPISQPPTTSKPANRPQIPQSHTLSKGANAAVATQTASAALIGAQMNATTQHLGELRSGKDQGGLWTRGYGTEQRLDTGTSRAFQQQVNGMEIGADTALPFADGTLYVGGLLGKGQARQDFGEASKGTIDSATLGGYASYLDRSGVYVDGAVKYSRLDNEVNITSNLGDKVKARYKNHAVSADVQVGKTLDLGQGWFVEPQAGLQVARISGGRYTASNGLEVEQDAMMSVQSRVGAMAGRNLQLDNGVAVKPYAKAAWITEHAGDSHVKVNGAELDSRLPGSRAEIGAGVSVKAADKHSFFAEAGYTHGSDIEQPWAVTVGYRYNW